MALLTGLILTGCSSHKANLGAATFKVWDGGLRTETTYELLPSGQKLMESLLARKPDTDIHAAIGLLPTGVLVVDEQKYAIEPDKIVLLGDNRTKIWDQKDIRKDLIKNSTTVKD